GGLETLTQALARALAPSVRVFGVAPGLIEQQPDVSSKLQEKWIERIPLQRAGTADEVAAVICGLIDAGSYLTGNIVYVDGGRSIV
ncbi:MAG: SDR family oxidoreductase, partial [Phycisphaerae bacterium]